MATKLFFLVLLSNLPKKKVKKKIRDNFTVL